MELESGLNCAGRYWLNNLLGINRLNLLRFTSLHAQKNISNNQTSQGHTNAKLSSDVRGDRSLTRELIKDPQN